MLRIEGLSKQYGDKLLFDGLSYQFPDKEKIALIGANGAGKSTLLHMICGEADLGGGRIHLPNKAVVGYLPQEPNLQPKESVVAECLTGATQISALQKKLAALLKRMEEDATTENIEAYSDVQADFEQLGGYALEARAQEILAGLGFSEERMQQSPKDLSGGWRMRVELAKLFLNNPDFLVLDEPTNHLDLPSLAWVEDYLKNFSGTLLFVSHDRDLLNRLSTVTLELARGRLTPFTGNFDAYLRQKEERLLHDQARADQLESQRKHLQKFVDRFGAKASKATQAQSRVKMIERIRAMEAELDVEASLAEIFFRIPAPPKAGRVVLEVFELQVGYEKPLLDPLHFQVERGMRIGIIGANGIGKTTMLRTISGKIAALAGHVNLGHNVSMSYFSQDHLEVLNESASVLESLLEANPDFGQRDARNVLGNFLFRGDEVKKPIRVLSGGEKSRVGLARVLVSKANMLVLDEPTNHLDMSSVEVLGDALANYEGTLLFVSHDRNFINRVATHILAVVPDGRWELFEGDLAGYQRLAKVAGFPDVLSPSHETPRPVVNSKSEPRQLGEREIKELQKRQRRLKRDAEALDVELTELRAALTAIDRKMHEVGNNPSELSRLLSESEHLRQEIDAKETAWLDIGEALDETIASLNAMGRL